jgi:hypothetical protein
MHRLVLLAVAMVIAGCAIDDPRPYKEGPFGIQIRDSAQEVDRESQFMRD